MAGLVAIFCIALIPLQYMGAQEAESQESKLQATIDAVVARVQSTKQLTEHDYTEIVDAVYDSDASYDIEISAGTKRYGSDDDDDTAINVAVMTYTNEILDEINTNGSYDFQPGDTITIRLTRKTSSTASKVSNLFLKTHTEANSFTAGGVISR